MTGRRNAVIVVVLVAIALIAALGLRVTMPGVHGDVTEPPEPAGPFFPGRAALASFGSSAVDVGGWHVSVPATWHVRDLDLGCDEFVEGWWLEPGGHEGPVTGDCALLNVGRAGVGIAVFDDKVQADGSDDFGTSGFTTRGWQQLWTDTSGLSAAERATVESVARRALGPSRLGGSYTSSGLDANLEQYVRERAPYEPALLATVRPGVPAGFLVHDVRTEADTIRFTLVNAKAGSVSSVFADVCLAATSAAALEYCARGPVATATDSSLGEIALVCADLDTCAWKEELPIGVAIASRAAALTHDQVATIFEGIEESMNG